MRHSGILWGTFLAGTAVILGAMGAHALESELSPESLESFKTGVRYQMYHALAILFLSIWLQRGYRNYVRITINLFIIGTICFSLSIYLLSTTAISGLELGFLGPVTPLGGVFLIIGWFVIFFGYLREILRSK
jgi:uncharacterized membrane protein YgdD (TMEM256/DUF423 family)